MQKSLVLFDLWDTLARLNNLEDSTKKVIDSLGKERYERFFGFFVEWHTNTNSLDVFMERLSTELHLTIEEQALLKKYVAHEETSLYDDTEKVLRELKERGKKLVLVSNSPPTTAEYLKELNIGFYFDAIILSFEVGVLKPTSEIFEIATKDFQIPKEEMIMIGDSLKSDI